MNNLRFLAGLASVVMATFVSAAPQPPVETTSITPTPAFFSSRFALDGNRIRLTLTLTNPNPSPLGVIVAAFSNGDAYNLGGAIPSNAMNSCGGTLDLLG